MIRLQDVRIKDRTMWVKEESVTAITRIPQDYPKGTVYWTIQGSGWEVMVQDLPTQLKWMVT